MLAAQSRNIVLKFEGLPSNAVLIGAEQTVYHSAWNLPSNTILIWAEQTVQKTQVSIMSQ